VLTKLRNSDGQDVDAGCGQLRARHAPGTVQPLRLMRAARAAPAPSRGSTG
jgi:23S rRNA (adenine2503-C2)-methyltransferase